MLPAQLSVTGIRSEPAASLCEFEDGNLLRCRFDGLGNGATATVTVEGALPRDATGTLVNAVSVGAEEEDPDPDDNAATLERPIGPPAPVPVDNPSEPTPPVIAGTPAPVQLDDAERQLDAGPVGRPLRGGLRIRTTASRRWARPGQLVRYTLRVRNRANVARAGAHPVRPAAGARDLRPGPRRSVPRRPGVLDAAAAAPREDVDGHARGPRRPGRARRLDPQRGPRGRREPGDAARRRAHPGRRRAARRRGGVTG